MLALVATCVRKRVARRARAKFLASPASAGYELAMGLVRLFLALVVAADHWWVIVLVPMGIAPEDSYKFGFNNGYAVMFFYVISGFLITYTLRRNYRHDLGGMGSILSQPVHPHLFALLATGHPHLHPDRRHVGTALRPGRHLGPADGPLPDRHGLAAGLRRLSLAPLGSGHRWPAPGLDARRRARCSTSPRRS